TGDTACPFFLNLCSSRSACRRRCDAGTYALHSYHMRSLPHRGVEIECHEPEQLRVLQLRQIQLGAAFQQLRRELPLRCDQLVDLFLDGPPADELVNQDVLDLPDTERPVGGMALDGRVTTENDVDHVLHGGEVQTI